MHCAPRTLCLAGGLSLAILGGCYSYYPTRPIGQPAYAPPPGGVVVPPGQPGQFFQPGPTLTPQPAPGTQPQWQTPSTSPEGSWDPAVNPNPVPEYGDPRDLGPAPTFGPSGQNNAPGSYNTGRLESSRGVAVASADVPGEFKPPMKIQQISASEEVFEDEIEESDLPAAVREGVAVAAASGPSPYDYDRENYTWLRGTAQFDPHEKAWHILYSVNPEESDPFGGDMTLIVDPKIATFRENDVVVVTGHVDPESPDSLGKPRYRVERAVKVLPGQQ